MTSVIAKTLQWVSYFTKKNTKTKQTKRKETTDDSCKTETEASSSERIEERTRDVLFCSLTRKDTG